MGGGWGFSRGVIEVREGGSWLEVECRGFREKSR